MKYVIGVDIGGTNLKVGAVSAAGELLFRTEVTTGVKEGKDATLKKILNTIEEVRHRIKGKIDLRDILNYICKVMSINSIF